MGTDFKLVGFDDNDVRAQAWSQLGSVHYDIAQFGQQTASTLLDWLESGKHVANKIRAPVELVVRASSGLGS